MSFKEYKRKKQAVRKKEAGTGTLMLCMMPFVIASMYYIVVLGAVV